MSDILNCNTIQGDYHSNNILQYKNMISPFCNEEIIGEIQPNNSKLIDSNYGLVYDESLITNNVNVYGLTNKLPTYSGDQLANYGFLRIPFRKIPRIKLKNRIELNDFIQSIENRDKNLILQFRGQNKEHFIERSSSEKKSLFGEDNILEPSLIPSAVRRNILLEDIMPLWNNLLHIYLDSLSSNIPENKKTEFSRELINFKTNVKFSVFSLALAQHYGLPSVGLDSTTNIETALFFATHKFNNKDGKYFYEYNLNKLENPPVIYVLAPAERFHVDYKDFKINHSKFLRPDKQNAKFLHTGWGLNKNRCARQIWVALYLDTDGDFGEISTAKNLFPADDEFANFLKPMIDKINNEQLNPYFKDFYTLD